MDGQQTKHRLSLILGWRRHLSVAYHVEAIYEPLSCIASPLLDGWVDSLFLPLLLKIELTVTHIAGYLRLAVKAHQMHISIDDIDVIARYCKFGSLISGIGIAADLREVFATSTSRILMRRPRTMSPACRMACNMILQFYP